MVWLRVAEALTAGWEAAGVPLRSSEDAGLPPLPGQGRSMEVRAWRVRHTKELMEAHARSWGYWPSPVGEWLVNGPFNAFWSWWYVACVHLRPVEGAPEPRRVYPEAEFEIAINSLDPEGEAGRPEEPDIDLVEAGDLLRGMPGFLSPPDLVKQFHGVTDEQAGRILDRMVEHIVAGNASPDSDFAGWWAGAIDKTVEHYAAGQHE
jgi:hypothetical protein